MRKKLLREWQVFLQARSFVQVVLHAAVKAGPVLISYADEQDCQACYCRKGDLNKLP